VEALDLLLVLSLVVDVDCLLNWRANQLDGLQRLLTKILKILRGRV